MKTLQELKGLYITKLAPDLELLEQERKKIVQKLAYTGAGVLAVCLIIFALFFNRAQNQMSLFFVPGAIGLVFIFGVYHFLTRDYVRSFKEKIIQRIVLFFDKNLAYSASSCIPQSQFVSCGIFKRSPDSYKGDDFVSGTLGATAIEFSEIHAEYKTEHSDSKGRRHTQWHTIFKGLFFVADFNKHFKGRTVVLPDTAERIFGHIGKMFQSWNIARADLVKLEDPEFEKLFAVYSDDQIEARYILSTSLMKRIVDFKKKSNRQIHLAFVRSHVYVAISYSKSLFEPRVFKTILDFAPIKEYFEDLTLAVGLVEDLNLNTRIWSKQ